MKYHILIALCFLLAGSCSSNKTRMDANEIIVTKPEDLEQYVNKVITLKGMVTNTKTPTIIGVDIASDNPDLRGQYAEATGKLIKLVLSEEDIDITSTNRGAGIFYRLQDLNYPEYDAPVRLVKK